MRFLLRWAWPGVALAVLAACGGEGSSPVPGSEGADAADAPAPAPRRSFERSLVFTSTGTGVRLVVPWILESTTRPGGVDRIHRGWLLRDAEWEPFYRSAWSTGPQREPWRVLPDGPFRILVGSGGRLDRIVFDGGGRQLELTLDEPLAEWTGNRGGAFTLLESGLILADRRVPGLLLDVSQGMRVTDGSPGDWIFLTSGAELALVVEAPLDEGEESPYQGWAVRDGEELDPWPLVEVDWSATRTFDPARRPIPDVVTLSTPDGRLSGRLEVRSIQLEARDGDGPVLPVDGLMDVAGQVTLEDGVEFPVQGLLRHRRR
ncbi:MAG: hypothetical protein P8188_01885 [Gemmatimonadota bacterium]|jgi:hypothetical protein